MAIVNAFISYRVMSTRPTKVHYTYSHFRRELTLHLINGFSDRPKKKKKVKIYMRRIRPENHGIHHMGNSACCRLHQYRRERRHETVYGCLQCGMNLSPEGGWDEIHANADQRNDVRQNGIVPMVPMP